MLDCTGSMESWIDRAKKTLQEVISNVDDRYDDKLKVKVCFLCIRNHSDAERFGIHNYSDIIQGLWNFISGVIATGGGDFPEDVLGRLRKF